MDEILKAFDSMTKSETYTNVAIEAAVSRNTIYNVRQNPERATLGILRRIVEAMGYQLIIKLEKVSNE
jgi:DNA-binding phage protein